MPVFEFNPLWLSRVALRGQAVIGSVCVALAWNFSLCLKCRKKRRADGTWRNKRWTLWDGRCCSSFCHCMNFITPIHFLIGNECLGQTERLPVGNIIPGDISPPYQHHSIRSMSCVFCVVLQQTPKRETLSFIKTLHFLQYVWQVQIPNPKYHTIEKVHLKSSRFVCLAFRRDRKEVYMGDDNSLTLTFNAKNDGGGAYEAELYVVLPPEADYSGIGRNNEVRYGRPALQVLAIKQTCARTCARSHVFNASAEKSQSQEKPHSWWRLNEFKARLCIFNDARSVLWTSWCKRVWMCHGFE